MKVRRALVSVFKKDGIVDLSRRLHRAGVEILSTGGTARLLKSEGIPVIPVEDVTGFPEMMDGRVKTLHPRIHGGILGLRDNPEHMRMMEENDIRPIDLVIINLYPFQEVAGRPDASDAEAIEMIDIGGPAMVRSAAKNHAHVGVVVDPADYEEVVAEIADSGGLSEETRRRLAAAAFRYTSRYDDAIGGYLGGGETSGNEPPERLRLDLPRAYKLRYGENPHQVAAFYREQGDLSGTIAGAEVLQGKKLSFNNLLDLDAAWAIASDFEAAAAAVIKHTNPAGAAIGATALEAFGRARETDPVSAFGGIVALNRQVDGDCAGAILEGFVEAVAAPGFTDEALEVFATKKNVRVLRLSGSLPDGGWDLRRIRGGLLLQAWDHNPAEAEWKVVTKREPGETERRALAFAWKVVRHVKSNAIVFTAEDRTLGVGAGQMSRVDSVTLARTKANAPLQGSVLASDAFFPFRDGVDAAAEAGATAVIQPGGSRRDDEVIAAADEHDIAMIFTGVRHFRH